MAETILLLNHFQINTSLLHQQRKVHHYVQLEGCPVTRSACFDDNLETFAPGESHVKKLVDLFPGALIAPRWLIGLRWKLIQFNHELAKEWGRDRRKPSGGEEAEVDGGNGCGTEWRTQSHPTKNRKLPEIDVLQFLRSWVGQSSVDHIYEKNEDQGILTG